MFFCLHFHFYFYHHDVPISTFFFVCVSLVLSLSLSRALLLSFVQQHIKYKVHKLKNFVILSSIFWFRFSCQWHIYFLSCLALGAIICLDCRNTMVNEVCTMFIMKLVTIEKRLRKNIGFEVECTYKWHVFFLKFNIFFRGSQCRLFIDFSIKIIQLHKKKKEKFNSVWWRNAVTYWCCSGVALEAIKNTNQRNLNYFKNNEFLFFIYVDIRLFFL